MSSKDIKKTVEKTAFNAKKASLDLMDASNGDVNKVLRLMAVMLKKNKEMLQKENKRDLKLGKEKGLSDAMIDRLTLSDKTLDNMVQGLKEVASIKSPLGVRYDERVRPNGLKIYKTKVPIGVIGIIYESRPNVTIDAAAICLKSKNAVLLRGGSESFYSNKALAVLFSKALKEVGLPDKAVQFIPTTERSAVDHMLVQSDTIDLVIPRGGENLIKAVVEKSHIPVIKHYKGVCHVYVSSTACMKKSIPIVVNSKVQRPGVCNAMETLLIDSELPKDKKERIINALLEEGVELVGDSKIRALDKRVKVAQEPDWDAEYLKLKLAVKTVNGVDEAIAHINKYGSSHTEAILSQKQWEITRFTKLVDTSSIMVNASTRFADGGEYGMGCEIGISTDKLHSRGPMGVEDLTTYKWIVEGTGQIRV